MGTCRAGRVVPGRSEVDAARTFLALGHAALAGMTARPPRGAARAPRRALSATRRVNPGTTAPCASAIASRAAIPQPRSTLRPPTPAARGIKRVRVTDAPPGFCGSGGALVSRSGRERVRPRLDSTLPGAPERYEPPVCVRETDTSPGRGLPMGRPLEGSLRACCARLFLTSHPAPWSSLALRAPRGPRRDCKLELHRETRVTEMPYDFLSILTHSQNLLQRPRIV